MLVSIKVEQMAVGKGEGTTMVPDPSTKFVMKLERPS